MTLAPYEIVLPTRNFDYAATAFNPLPETNLRAYGYLNDWITQIYYNGANDFYMIQFTDGVMNYKRMTSNPVNMSATPYIYTLGGNVLFLNEYLDKGIQWSYYPAFFDFLSGAVNGFAAFNYSIDNPCFPQGSISCHTTAGQAFVALYQGGTVGLQSLISSSAGCPASNNYGATLFSQASNGPYTPGNGKVVTTYQETSVGAVDPIMRSQADLPLMFGQNLKGAGVDLGNNLIAVLTGSSTGGNGTILRVYRWAINITNANGLNACTLNSLGLRVYLLYERDLCDFLTGPRTGNYGGKLTSRHNNSLVAFAHNGTEGAAFYITFPGPIIQKITRTGGYSFNAEYTHYIEPHTNKMMFVFQSNGSVQSSTQTLVLNLKFTLPSRPHIINVKNTNTWDVIT